MSVRIQKVIVPNISSNTYSLSLPIREDYSRKPKECLVEEDNNAASKARLLKVIQLSSLMDTGMLPLTVYISIVECDVYGPCLYYRELVLIEL